MLKRWVTFIHERFPLLSHIPMILAFTGVHMVMVGGEWLALFLTSIGSAFFFFKLRLYDEIKDYEIDLKINPTRPLARNLVNHRQMRRAIFVSLICELTAFAFLGWPAFSAMVFAVAYSLLMNDEFFLKETIRPHLTFYAVIHTVSSGILSLALFAALRDTVVWELSAEDVAFSAACWCVFNVFEFGRKTFASSEEREDVESYSKVWSRPGAVGLVLSQIAGATVLLAQFSDVAGPSCWWTQGALFAIVAIAGGVYIAKNSKTTATIYRGVAQAYIFSSLVGAALLNFF